MALQISCTSRTIFEAAASSGAFIVSSSGWAGIAQKEIPVAPDLKALVAPSGLETWVYTDLLSIIRTTKITRTAIVRTVGGPVIISNP